MSIFIRLTYTMLLLGILNVELSHGKTILITLSSFIDDPVVAHDHNSIGPLFDDHSWSKDFDVAKSCEYEHIVISGHGLTIEGFPLPFIGLKSSVKYDNVDKFIIDDIKFYKKLMSCEGPITLTLFLCAHLGKDMKSKFDMSMFKLKSPEYNKLNILHAPFGKPLRSGTFLTKLDEIREATQQQKKNQKPLDIGVVVKDGKHIKYVMRDMTKERLDSLMSKKGSEFTTIMNERMSSRLRKVDSTDKWSDHFEDHSIELDSEKINEIKELFSKEETSINEIKRLKGVMSDRSMGKLMEEIGEELTDLSSKEAELASLKTLNKDAVAAWAKINKKFDTDEHKEVKRTNVLINTLQDIIDAKKKEHSQARKKAQATYDENELIKDLEKTLKDIKDNEKYRWILDV